MGKPASGAQNETAASSEYSGTGSQTASIETCSTFAVLKGKCKAKAVPHVHFLFLFFLGLFKTSSGGHEWTTL